MMENGTSLSAADVAAVTGGNRGFGGYGGYGDGGFYWILILFLFAMMGNWGGNWGGNNGGGGYGAPYVYNDVQRGFDQQAVMSQLGTIGTAVNNGFSNAEVGACNRATTLLTNMNQGFNTVGMGLCQGFNGVGMGIADLKYTVATENCADRQVVSDGLRDVIANNTANTNAIIQSQQAGFQGIQDKLCQLELDSFKQKVADQAAEIAALKAGISNTAQTAQLIAAGQAQANQVIASCCPKPVPAYVVANPNGCGCNGGYLG